MNSIKIIKYNTLYYGDAYGDEQEIVKLFQSDPNDFIEVDDKDYKEIKEAIEYVNRQFYNNRERYLLIEKPILSGKDEDNTSGYVDDILKFMKIDKAKQAKEAKIYAEREAKRKATAEANALKRKQKQLEKLKKELGENN